VVFPVIWNAREARRWLEFALVSAVFFHITGSTFTSLGVVLPLMAKELSWSWTQAGLGFTLLALFTGLANTAAAWSTRNLGIRATYGIGGAVMVTGFVLLAQAHGLYTYLAGSSLVGGGFALCATVPAIHLLNNLMPERRSLVIGAYMTIGGLGGVAGPLAATGISTLTGTWRMHWWAMAGSLLFLTMLVVLLVRNPAAAAAGESGGREQPREKTSGNVYQTQTDWKYRDVLWTRQYHVILAAITAVLFCTVTMNTWAVTHMGKLGVPATVAAAAISADSAINALSRVVGGVLATRIDPKWLLVSALGAEIVGMLSLAVADNMFAIALFAIGDGYAFGMCYFSAILLLVNYFGPKDNPEILGTMNLVTTAAMLGPVLGGMVGDRLGGFGVVFQAFAVIVLLIFIAAVMMRPPRHPAAPGAG
jgi:MFS family permease